MRLGYLGPKGSYSYLAAIAFSPQAATVAMGSFPEIIQGVENGLISHGILAMENSTEGAVTASIDALMQTEVARIEGELTISIDHSLLGEASRPSQIERVYSHPQALEQCRQFFQKNYPQVKLLPCDSSSQACILAKAEGPSCGAIAHKLAAELYQLPVLLTGIQDNLFNQTRFVLIGRQDAPITGRDKTSIAFAFHDDAPGSLIAVLKEFATENINLTRIESRPAKVEMGKYIFYIDFEGHQLDPAPKRVLAIVAQITSRLKVFGSYPVGRTVD